MAYTVEVETKAAREIRDLPKSDQRRVVAKIETLAANPRPAGSTKLEGNSNLWRVRVGDYRILYEIRDQKLIVMVVKVGHRRDVYRGK